MSRSLKRLLDLLATKKGVLAREMARLARCQQRNQRNPGVCNGIWVRIQYIQNAISRLQQRIDRLLARTQQACNRSFPVPGQNPPPSDCEQEEARNYCPVNSPEEALDSLTRRCDDLRAEIALAAIDCKPKDPCFDMRAAGFVRDNLGDLFEKLAEFGSCPVPTPEATGTASATPSVTVTVAPTATATPVMTTPAPTPLVSHTVTPVPTEIANICHYQSGSAPSSGEQCSPVHSVDGRPGYICCEAILS